jgi:hypothetical protein
MVEHSLGRRFRPNGASTGIDEEVVGVDARQL